MTWRAMCGRPSASAQQASVKRQMDKSAQRHNTAMSDRLAKRKVDQAAKVQGAAAAKAARAAAGIDEVDAVQEEAVNLDGSPSSPTKSAKKQTGFLDGIRKGMRERALAAAMVQQQSLLAGPRRAAPFLHLNLIVCSRCARSHSPHPPPWPGHSFPF